MSSFFASRWVPCPDHVTELGGDGLPAGFRAAGVAAGIKESGSPDVGVIVCDAPEATSAARFTASGTQAPPVLLCRERTRLGALRAVVVNSGNANAATGRPGFENAAKMQGMGALVAGVKEDQVAVCSTGVIGVPLPMQNITQGIVAAAHGLAADGDASFSAAIRTTDAFEKRARLQVNLPSGTVTLTGQAKGAGMISPGFATLLVFVQTDAKLSPETSDLLLGVCVKRSFERVSVDGQLSTNDTVILQCSGESGVAIDPETEDELRFGEALDALMRQLALLVVRDGEGAGASGASWCAAAMTTPCPPSPGPWPTPHSSRPRCTAETPTGAGSSRRSAPPCPERRPCPSTSRSRACRSAPAAATWLTTRRRWPGGDPRRGRV